MSQFGDECEECCHVDSGRELYEMRNLDCKEICATMK